MSSGKVAKGRSDASLKAKTVLSNLEKLSNSNSPDRDQIRFLCHNLLQLVTSQDSTKKEITSKAGLDIILLTLESSNDQATCMALVATLTEISRAGNGAVKRLISHDATRVLLHTLSYIGSDLDCRLLSAIIHLLAKLGPKDRRFALRSRLTGSLPIILNTVRSSFTYTSHARLLPASLSVLKLALTASSTNAGLLGRAGAVNVLHRIILTLSKKQTIPLKNALASVNLLVRYSKANCGRAVKLGVLDHILKMHQDYHKHDLKYEKHCAIRKSILNIIKNIVSSKSGRKAFCDSNGLMIMYKSCRGYLESDYNNKSSDLLLNVGIIIIRRCQPKVRLPVVNTRCSFQFALPGGRERSDSFENTNTMDDSDDDLEDTDTLSNDENDDNEGSASSTKGSANKGTNGNDNREFKSKSVTRPVEDLKMYEEFFPELLDFPLPKDDMSWLGAESRFRPHTSVEASSTAARQTMFGPSLFENNQIEPDQTRFLSSSLNSRSRRLQSTAPVSSLSRELRCPEVESKMKNDSSLFSEQVRGRSILSSQYSPKPSNRLYNNDYGRQNKFADLGGIASTNDGSILESSMGLLATCLSAIDDGMFAVGSRAEMVNVRKQAADAIQKLAANTISVKETVNRLSQADAWGCITPEKVEKQSNKKFVQRLIKSKILDDLARSLLPSKVGNRLVYMNDEKFYDKADFPLIENEQIFKCDVYPPEIDRQYETDSTEKNSSSTGLDLEDLSLSSNATRNACKLVVNIPTQGNISSSTSVSSDTWPGVYYDKTNDSTESSTATEDRFSMRLHPPSTHERRSSTSMSSRGLAKFAHSLKFDSSFESGNLRAAVQVREFEYDLVLNPDCNSNHHFQWFHFEVSRMKPSQSYRFNIINCEKKGSVINEGMQPVMFSMTEAKLGRPSWVRVGMDTCYYRNHFLKGFSSAGGSKKTTFFTLTFTVIFQHDNDTCYFAYHYPYTYTKLQTDLRQFTEKVDAATMYVRNQTFCHTLSGNPVPVLTITAPPDLTRLCSKREAIEEFRSRPYIFLSSRVHPGESNASWTMRGTLRLLLTPTPSRTEPESIASIANELRRSFIFKIVPMLNPDGVINGHHRCSLSGEDLNRTWQDPNPALFPTIYHTKGLLQYLQSIKKAPLVYCDYHGHSRKMNVFLYGCSRRESIAAGETTSVVDGPVDQGFKTLPKLLDHFAAPFSFKNCSFVVEKSKVSTARVVVWKEIGVARSYTMESTYCGCDQGSLRGRQITTKELEDMGSKLCEVLLHLTDRGAGTGLMLFDSDEEDDIPNMRRLPKNSEKTNEDGDRKSPLCPVNSDAELTPDEDLWDIDESYDDVFPSSNNVDNNSFFRDMLEEQRRTTSNNIDYSFWTFHSDSESYANKDKHSLFPDFPSLSSDQSSVSVTDGSSQDTSISPSRERQKSSRGRQKPDRLVCGRVSPSTGRVRNFDPEQVATTAPRPFESGLVLRKPSRSRSPKSPTVSLPSTSGLGKVENNRTTRGKTRSFKASK